MKYYLITKGEVMRVELDMEAIKAIETPINGEGGHQTLMRKLKEQFVCPHLSYDQEDYEKLVRYARDYGQGGYQSRFEKILSCIEKQS